MTTPVISDISTTCIAVPLRRAEVWTDGRRDGTNAVLIEIRTNTGLIGYGEAACGPGNSADPARSVIENVRPLLLGHSPLRIAHHVSRFYGVGRWRLWRSFSNAALAGIEMALWDLAGKMRGCAVSELLGGRQRDTLPVFGYVMHDEPERMADEAQRLLLNGFEVLYFKVGLSLEEDERALRAVRDAVGSEVRLRIDANEAWTRYQATHSLARLAPYGLDLVEQPLAARDLRGMAQLRAASSVPVAANQSAWTLDDMMQVVLCDAADVIVTGVQSLGGMLALLKAGGICDAAGISLCRHSPAELGLSAAASAQVLATLNCLDDAHQSLDPYWEDDIVVGDTVRVSRGRQPVPAGPGLGVEPDPDRIADFAARYRKDGPFIVKPV
jgi:L-alanine-DL-glutamate epimerase-like enolase superfamily enzyme